MHGTTSYLTKIDSTGAVSLMTATGRLLVQTPTKAEAEQIEKWFNEPKTERFFNIDYPIIHPAEMESIPEVVDTNFRAFLIPRMGDELERWGFKSVRRRRGGEYSFPFSIIEKKAGKLVGFVNLDASLAHKHGEIRTLIEPAERRKGFGSEAKVLILNFGFEMLKLRIIYSHTLDINKANYACNIRCGFQIEGRVKSFALDAENTPHDLIRMLVRSEEWLATRTRYEAWFYERQKLVTTPHVE